MALGAENSENIGKITRDVENATYGAQVQPIFTNGAATYTAPDNQYIYAIQADGAAAVTISAFTYIDTAATAYANVGTWTIPAGGIDYPVCKSFTLTGSGKARYFLKPLSENI
jgi:hypothetical protein